MLERGVASSVSESDVMQGDGWLNASRDTGCAADGGDGASSWWNSAQGHCRIEIKKVIRNVSATQLNAETSRAGHNAVVSR
jgi:adenosylmethionine-8-amino-7-oxononanoate aminotransferase